MRLTASLLCLSLAATSLPASELCTEDAMIVFDGSGSMAESGFNDIDVPRIFEAREAMRTALPEIAEMRRLGLIIYGPSARHACSGVDLRFPPMDDAAGPIMGALDALEPDGKTALTEAVRQAAEVLNYRDAPATVVLVTDGKETCGGTPCRLATDLERDGANFTVHVIGFKVRGDFYDWAQAPEQYVQADAPARCLADMTGGTYVRSETLGELIAALRVTLGCNVLF
jgi:Ca-activated chloride channel family protein